MNTTAGVGGPALSVYAIATRWEQIPSPQPFPFAATMQPYFTTIGAASVTAKLLAQPAATPQLTILEWAGLLLAIVVGLITGEALAKRIRPTAARRLMIILAYCRAVIATGRGAWEIIGF